MKSVLFVDSNEVLSRLSCEVLQMEGYKAVPAYNAKQALALFDQQDFDIVVTDSRTGEMDGLELARAIRAKAPELPVIMLTAHGRLEGADDVNVCLDKQQGLFPALLENIRLCLLEAERQSSR